LGTPQASARDTARAGDASPLRADFISTGRILVCLRAGPRAGPAGNFRNWCDDARVPLICPTCQSVFPGRSASAGDPRLLCMGLFSMFWSPPTPMSPQAPGEGSFAGRRTGPSRCRRGHRRALSLWHGLAKPKLAKRAKCGNCEKPTRLSGRTVRAARPARRSNSLEL
jgi:hypothetical protein